MKAWYFPFLLFFFPYWSDAAPTEMADEPPNVTEESADAAEDSEATTTMAAYNVKAGRVEDFGMRVWVRRDSQRSSMFWPVATPLINSILPNTAAAKAGLKPGERILKSDGQPTTATLFSHNKWRQLQERKWAEVRSGKKNVTWTLEVQSADAKQTRTVKLVVPTPPPHWGATTWQPPQDRAPATMVEPGPLAERSRAMLDNGVWKLEPAFNRVVGIPPGAEVLGYEWRLADHDKVSHRMFVTQARGRTDIIFWVDRSGIVTHTFATSPAGALEKALSWRKGLHEMPIDEARQAFQKEIDFWLNQVGKVSARWPFEVISEQNELLADGMDAPKTVPRVPTLAVGVRAKAFLELSLATESQRTLLADAFGKLGTDEDHWAYTEISHGLDDKHVAVMRIDPSKPPAERSTLLKMDGKPPTVADVQRWRDQGRDAPAALGELPPISSIVDATEVRVLADEVTAFVFELPVRGGNKEFPAEKFQAVFRVNKTRRAFEDITVKMRESFRVAGVVKITEAGIEMRFQTLDPAYPPQPVLLKGGGAVRVLVVKIARDFSAARSDFVRVESFDEITATRERAANEVTAVESGK